MTNSRKEWPEVRKLCEDLAVYYRGQGPIGSLYGDFERLREDFNELFAFHGVQRELIHADFDTYLSFVEGLACGGIHSLLDDGWERYKAQGWLHKSFYEWFPKYKFMEPYDLADYPDLLQAIAITDELRTRLLNILRACERRD